MATWSFLKFDKGQQAWWLATWALKNNVRGHCHSSKSNSKKFWRNIKCLIETDNDTVDNVTFKNPIAGEIIAKSTRDMGTPIYRAPICVAYVEILTFPWELSPSRPYWPCYWPVYLPGRGGPTPIKYTGTNRCRMKWVVARVAANTGRPSTNTFYL